MLRATYRKFGKSLICKLANPVAGTMYSLFYGNTLTTLLLTIYNA